jgi:hypothetical protein
MATAIALFSAVAGLALLLARISFIALAIGALPQPDGPKGRRGGTGSGARAA